MALTPQQREIALSMDADAPDPAPQVVDSLRAALAGARQDDTAESAA